MMRNRPAVTFCTLAALLSLWSATAVAAPRFGGMTELYLYPYVQYFHWQEESGGRKLLTESGPIYGLGTAVGLDLLRTGDSGTLVLKTKGELFGGVVDYDGQTQSANMTLNARPLKTDVDYIGFNAEGRLGWRFSPNQYELEPFVGVGYKWWTRDLHGSTAIDTNNDQFAVPGYTEEWQSIYARAGLSAAYRFSNDWQLFVDAGAKYPFYNSNTASISEIGDVTLRPANRWSGFAEVGYRYKKLRPFIYYEGYRTGQSPTVGGYFQPRSAEDVVGVSVGYCFR